jgi:hypothetical protein
MGKFREHSGNIGPFREHSGNMGGNIQGTLGSKHTWKDSKTVPMGMAKRPMPSTKYAQHSTLPAWTGVFREHSVRVEVDAREPPFQLQEALKESIKVDEEHNEEYPTWVPKTRFNKTKRRREHSGNIQRKVREHSWYIQGTSGEHSGNN